MTWVPIKQGAAVERDGAGLTLTKQEEPQDSLLSRDGAQRFQATRDGIRPSFWAVAPRSFTSGSKCLSTAAITINVRYREYSADGCMVSPG